MIKAISLIVICLDGVIEWEVASGVDTVVFLKWVMVLWELDCDYLVNCIFAWIVPYYLGT